MFQITNLRIPRPPNKLFLGILLMFFFCLDVGGAAAATVDKSVRWSKSPLKDALGQTLPPAVGYEVWVRPSGGTESLVATVNDTTYVLRATVGVTYTVRVRGVSALGLKSLFSEYSAPWQAPGASDEPPAAVATFGPAFPNPFNARTTIAYSIPDGLPSDAALGMEIFDVRGRRLRVFELDRGPGTHELPWDGRDDDGVQVPAGLYIARFVCDAFTANTKLTLLP